MTRRRISTIAAAILVLGLALPVSRTLAQFELPPEVIRTGDFSAEQTQQLDRYVSDALQRLSSDDAREMKAGRDRLLAPLRARDISVRFRQEYTKKLVPGLRPLADAESELTVINVLRISGELATNDAVAVLERKLDDQRVAVRYAAIAGIGRSFDAIAGTSPAVTPDRVQSLLRRVGTRVETEPAALVVDAGTRALISAMAIGQPGFENTRSAAFGVMATSLGKRLTDAGAHRYDAELGIAVLRAGEAARDALVLNDPARALSQESARQAGALGGHMVTYVMRRLQAGDFPAGEPEAREAPAQLLAVAETAVPLAGHRLGPRGEIPRLSEDFKQASAASDREFFQKAVSFVSSLQREPFNFPADTFITEDTRTGRR